MPMLTIRKAQIDLFTEVGVRRFQQKLVDLVKNHWPDAWAERGEVAVRDQVQAALAKATTYGFEREYDIQRYVNITFALGLDFDASARYPWAAALLQDRAQDAGARMDRLCYWTTQVLTREQPALQ